MKTYTQEQLEILTERELVQILLTQSRSSEKCLSIVEGILEKELSYNKNARFVTTEIKEEACRDYIEQMTTEYLQYLAKDELIPMILFGQTPAGRAALRAHSAVASNMDRSLKSWMIRFAAVLDKFYDDLELSKSEGCIAPPQL